jgi:hypothetical protein
MIRVSMLGLLLGLTGCSGVVMPPAPDAGATDDGGANTCADTWEGYGQAFFATNCVTCHVHDHSNFADVAAVRGELALITERVSTGLMPQGATLPAAQQQRLLDFISCGAPDAPSDAGYVFEAEPARVAVAKVKGLLIGQAPTDLEVAAVAADPSAMKALIAQWMTDPAYEQKMRVFFELAFQQTQVTQADFNDFLPGLPNAPGLALLVQNARESFARTVLAYDTQGRPFTDAFTTHQVMMTPALMELYAYMETRRLDDAAKPTDHLPATTAMMVLTGDGGVVPLAQSVDPTSPNFMHWHDSDVGNLSYPTDPTCNTDPIVMPVTSLGIHSILYGAVAGRPRPGMTNCPNRGGTLAGTQFAPTDFTDWKLVTIRPPATGEAVTRFYDLPLLRTATELVLTTPRVGFLTPAFYANWPTNSSNQMRVTVNQALIVATGHQVDGLDTMASPSTPGLDTVHAADAACNSCHRLLDPTRSILASTYSWYYYPQTDPTLMAQKGRFMFQGVDTTVASLDDFMNVLAHHPLVPTAWAQKLCTAVNSSRCLESDPEFQRVVMAFTTSNSSWSTLVTELLSSPIVTNLSATATNAANGEVIAVSRRDQLCAALNTRLQLADACGLTLALGAGAPGIGTVPKIVGGLPSDGYGRGSTEPVLPNSPTLFYRAGLENICEQVAAQVIDAAVSPKQPNAKHWVSSAPDAAIADFVSLLVGLAPSDPRTAAVTAVLKKHFTDASTTQSKTDALKSTFTAACLSPTFIGVGM